MDQAVVETPSEYDEAESWGGVPARCCAEDYANADMYQE